MMCIFGKPCSTWKSPCGISKNPIRVQIAFATRMAYPNIGMIFYRSWIVISKFKFIIMLAKKRNYAAPAGGLLLAGLAAFAYYKYSRLSSDEKQDLLNNLKERGRKLVGQFSGNQDNQFAQGSQYSG
jgi:hypothetical protein